MIAAPNVVGAPVTRLRPLSGSQCPSNRCKGQCRRWHRPRGATRIGVQIVAQHRLDVEQGFIATAKVCTLLNRKRLPFLATSTSSGEAHTGSPGTLFYRVLTLRRLATKKVRS